VEKSFIEITAGMALVSPTQVLPKHQKHHRAVAELEHEVHAVQGARQVRATPLQNGKGIEGRPASPKPAPHAR
jgi:fatty acid desaturase